MKKRVVAIVLCLTMVLTGTGTVSAAEVVSETISAEAAEIAESPASVVEPGTIDPVIEESTEDEEVLLEEETEAAEETVEETPAAETEETVSEETTDFGFDDGLAAESTAAQTADVNYEAEGRLYYSRWEKVVDEDGTEHWKLQKYKAAETAEASEETSETVEAETEAAAEETAEVTVETAAESVPEAAAETEAEEAETVPETAAEYYTAEDGIVTITTIYTDNTELFSGKYFFDENGYLLSGDQTVNGTVYHFTTAEEAAAAKENTDAAETEQKEEALADLDLFFYGFGAQTEAAYSDTWVWAASEQKFVYYDENGGKCDTIPEDKRVCYYGGYLFYLNEDGTTVEGEVENIVVSQPVTEENGIATVDETAVMAASETTAAVEESAEAQETEAEETESAQTETAQPADTAETPKAEDYLFVMTVDVDGESVPNAAVANTWTWDGSKFTYYQADATAKTFTDKEICEPYSGLKVCLKTDGTPYTGITKVGNDTYRFSETYTATGNENIQGLTAGTQITCVMTKGKWAKDSAAKKSSEKYGCQYRYFDADGKYVKKAAGLYKAENNSTQYFLYADGYPVRSTYAKAANGKKYASDSNGVVYKNCVISVKTVNKKKVVKDGKKRYSGYTRYYMKSDGTLSTYKNRWVYLKTYNRYFYFGKTKGAIKELSGFQKVTVSGTYKGWVYFDKKSGNPIRNKWSGSRYYKADSILASGITKVNGKYYFFRKSTTAKAYGNVYKSQIIQGKANGKTVYFGADSKGVLKKTGWLRIQGSWYYFKNYHAVRNKKIAKDGVYGYTDTYGVWTSGGWKVVNDAKNWVRCLNPKTGKWYTSADGIVEIDGKEYRFQKNGLRVNNRASEYQTKYKGKFYLECDKTNGVMTVYTGKDKTIPVRAIRVSVGNPTTLTPDGTFTLHKYNARWIPLMGPSWGQYGTHVYAGIYVHSVAAGMQSSYALPADQYDKLGYPASHGCIRTCVADALWVWTYCDGGTIRVFSGKAISQGSLKGPLGKPPLTRRKTNCTDPTDPTVKA